MRRPAAAAWAAAALYFLLTIALTWPLVLHPGSRVANDLGDSLLNMFLFDWNARVTPLTARWWSLPQFYPIAGVMAFSEHLLGLAPITSPVLWVTHNPLLAYNTAFFLSFPLCALAAHLLCYELTGRHDAAVVAGLAYGFSPYRMSQFSHVQVLSAYWIPVALLGLHLFLRRREWRWAALFAVAWFLQALACGYYLFYLSVLAGLWLLWFATRAGVARDFWRVIVAWGVAAAAMLPIALGYWQYQHMYGLRRWPDEIEAFSADVASLLSAPSNLRLWGWLDVVQRPESQLFPGLAVPLLLLSGIVLAWTAAAREGHRRLRTPRLLLGAAAVFATVAATPLLFGPWRLEIAGVRLLSVGTPQKPFSVAVLLAAIALGLHPAVRTGWRRRSPLAFYTIAGAVMWLFCLGPSPTLLNQPLLYKAPYSWLLLLPGADGVRVPARFWILATACGAAAAGLAWVQVAARLPRLRSALPAVLCGLILLEAWPEAVPLLDPPAPRPATTRASARLELPVRAGHDLIALYRATGHHRPLLNGYSGYFAPHYWAMQHLLDRHDPRVLDVLSSLGPIEVVIDSDQDQDGEWRAYVGSHPRAEIAGREADYTVFRIARNTTSYALPGLAGQPLPIAAIHASVNEGAVSRMIDRDRITRWDSGGPQGPGNEITVDLGAARRVDGIEMQIAGFVADFPRDLTIDLSGDGQTWRQVWSGATGFAALISALESPLTVPIRLPFEPSEARYIRLQQHAREPIYYWSIAELSVFGT